MPMTTPPTSPTVAPGALAKKVPEKSMTNHAAKAWSEFTGMFASKPTAAPATGATTGGRRRRARKSKKVRKSKNARKSKKARKCTRCTRSKKCTKCKKSRRNR